MDYSNVFDGLTEGQRSVIEHILHSFVAPVETTILEGSWLVTRKWNDAFEARIRSHHALSEEPLSREQFEVALAEACRLDGWDVVDASSATQRFYDVELFRDGDGKVGKRYSLKSSSAKAMKRTHIHISKLCEAAWIQDARKQSVRRAKIISLFDEYTATVEGILMLRCFRKGAVHLYELVEIPSALFEPVQKITLSQAQESTIKIPPSTSEPDSDVSSIDPDLKLRLDRSDAKVTIADIRLDRCIVHARWKLSVKSLV